MNERPAFDRPVLVGEIGRPQGVRGEIRLKSFTGDPLAIKRYTPLLGEKPGETYVIEAARLVPGTADMLVVRLKGIDSREAAQALTRRKLLVPRERLAAQTLDEDEYLQADLVGLTVEDSADVHVGRVLGIANYGAGDLLEVQPDTTARNMAGRAGTLLLPFTRAFVPVVDVASGRVVVDAALLANFLTDEAPASDEADTP